MTTITFKAKPETIYNPDNSPAWRWIKVPALKRSHCDMNAFRQSKKFGQYANSDLFPSMLARAVKAKGIGQHIRLDRIPDGVVVDESGFLARVTIKLES